MSFSLPAPDLTLRSYARNQEAHMNPRFGFPIQPSSRPVTPMVYVKDKTVWEYKVLVRNLSKEEAPSEQELNALGKEGWELAGVFSDSPFIQFYFKRLKD
jgi:hypothetical protein